VKIQRLGCCESFMSQSEKSSNFPPKNWRRPPGRARTTWKENVHDDLSSLYLEKHEARDLAQNRPLWRLMSLHSATHL